VSTKDRVAGAVLVVLGISTATAIGWFIYKTRFARHAVVLLLPLWFVLHGILLLVGIHARDFFTWWNRLTPIPRIAIHVLGWLALMALVWFLVMARRPPA
jgi:hypothetical protein